MSLDLVQAKNEILSPFATLWATLGFYASYPGMDGEAPPSAAPWARATVRHADGGQSTLSGPCNGQSRYEMVGTLFVQVFTPIGDGSLLGLQLSQQVADAYRTARGLDVSFSRVRINEVGASGTFDQINVLSDFRYDQSR